VEQDLDSGKSSSFGRLKFGQVGSPLSPCWVISQVVRKRTFFKIGFSFMGASEKWRCHIWSKEHIRRRTHHTTIALTIQL